MHQRIFRQNSGLSKSSSTPAPNPFQSRPFSPPHEVSPQPEETPDLQQQQGQRKSSGYNFANVSVTPRETYPLPLPMLQRKLMTGEPGDKYEQEADTVARQVVDQIHAPQPKIQPQVQRQPIQSVGAKPSLSSVNQLNAVLQRKILVGDQWKKHYDDELVSKQHEAVKPYLRQWKEMDKVFTASTRQKTKEAKEKYLTDELEQDIRKMLRKYNEKKNFDNDKELTRQLVQDIKLKLLGMESIIGIDHQDGQFSEKADDAAVGRTGKGRKVRIYRTMSTEDWNTYEQSKNPIDILKGHGGSLGQALHYFLLSKAANLDDVLVEFEFSQTAQNLIDYTQIQRGGEGKGPKDNKLTGKSEQNDIMDLDEEKFSINLSKSKELISQLNPKISIKDKVRD